MSCCFSSFEPSTLQVQLAGSPETALGKRAGSQLAVGAALRLAFLWCLPVALISAESEACSLFALLIRLLISCSWHATSVAQGSSLSATCAKAAEAGAQPSPLLQPYGRPSSIASLSRMAGVCRRYASDAIRAVAQVCVQAGGRGRAARVGGAWFLLLWVGGGCQWVGAFVTVGGFRLCKVHVLCRHLEEVKSWDVDPLGDGRGAGGLMRRVGWTC